MHDVQTVSDLLRDLDRLGVKLWLEGDQLRYRALPEAGREWLPAVRERKAAIVAHLRQAGGARWADLVTGPRPALVPISVAQQGIWFLNRLGLLGPAYNIWFVVRMRGALDPGALERALREVVRRHESLRTRFVTVDGQGTQVVDAPGGFELEAVDLSALAEPARSARAQALVDAPSEYRFDLERGGLFRATLVRLAADEHVLVLAMHHIIMDAWSKAILERELSVLYAAFRAGEPSPLPEPAAQYADYALWQRREPQERALAAQIAYWRGRLAGLPDVLDLPTDRPRPDTPSFRGGTLSFTVPPPVAEAVTALARAADMTPFMVLLAAFQTLLGRMAGQRNVGVGTTIARRDHEQTEDIIGCFLNTLVLHCDLADEPTFRELLIRTRTTVLEAYEHQDVPFDVLVAELQPARELGRQPLFQVGFFHSGKGQGGIRLPGLEVTVVSPQAHTSKFDLSLFVTEAEHGLEWSLEYATDLFERGTVERLANHFCTLLAAVVADPDVRVGEVALLSSAERHELVVDWNAGVQPSGGEGWVPGGEGWVPGACVHEVFEVQAARRPHALALMHEEDRLSYGELNARANQLAHSLRQMGVGPDTLVGLCLDRTPVLVVALLAVLKAGGAYVPLDPAYPRERLGHMLADSGASVLVTHTSLLDLLPEHDAQVVCVDRDWPEIACQPSTNPVNRTRPANLAYCIYTSGSTGRPKAAAVTHAATTAFLHWAATTFGGEQVCVAFATSICFDPSLFELFTALLSGGSVVLVEHVLALAEAPARASITLLNTVPSAMTALLAQAGDFAALRTVTLAGEALAHTLPARIQAALPAVAIWNLYGSSETTYASAGRLDPTPGARPTIGRPIPSVQLYVLDAYRQPVPIGVIGQIHVAGAASARCYLHRPAHTAQRFVPNPFGSAGSRMFASGDLARYRADGTIELVGRADQQVKIRGYRVELGEIEAALLDHHAVREAVVVTRDTAAEERTLAAYVTAANDSLDVTALREHVRRRLPGYMVPATIELLDAFPLTPSGKLDRGALAAAQTQLEQTEFVAPRTPIERALAEIWEEVLAIEPVGALDNFFDLGGHSLSAVRVQARLLETFDADVPLTAFYDTPTLADLANFIIGQMLGDDQASIEAALTSLGNPA